MSPSKGRIANIIKQSNPSVDFSKIQGMVHSVFQRIGMMASVSDVTPILDSLMKENGLKYPDESFIDHPKPRKPLDPEASRNAARETIISLFIAESSAMSPSIDTLTEHVLRASPSLS